MGLDLSDKLGVFMTKILGGRVISAGGDIGCLPVLGDKLANSPIIWLYYCFVPGFTLLKIRLSRTGQGNIPALGAHVSPHAPVRQPDKHAFRRSARRASDRPTRGQEGGRASRITLYYVRLLACGVIQPDRQKRTRTLISLTIHLKMIISACFG